MQSLLNSFHIPAQKVVRKRNSGYYHAEFFVPDMAEPVESAHVHAQALRRCFPQQIEIIDTQDTIADWRNDQPIICATVTFAVHPLAL